MNNNTIKIFVSGDFAPRLRVNEVIEKGDYAQLFGDILPIIKDADYSITNLEAPLIESGTPIAKTGPNLKAPVKSIEALKFAGFNMVTLANNHIMDYGEEGLFSTIEICKKNNIDYIGVGKNLEEAQKVKYVTIKDKTFSFINIAENEWSTTDGERPGANPLNEVYVYYQIQEAKRNSDYVILLIHGGHETYELPSPRMKRLYRWFVDLGADVVIGNHTHCFSGDEIYMGKPIIYSLGNFVFDHKSNNHNWWNNGVGVTLTFENRIIQTQFHPFYQCNDSASIKMYNFEEVKQFEDKRIAKSAIIFDDKELEKEFDKFVDYNSTRYNTYLESHNNKLIRYAIKKSWIKGSIKGAYKRLFLNLMRTESHREILLRLLTK